MRGYDLRMSNPTSSPTSGPTSGASGFRPGRANDDRVRRGTTARRRGLAGIWGAALIAVIAAAAIALLGGLLAITAGLVAVPGVAAYLVGQALRASDGPGSSAPGAPTSRTAAAIGLAIAVVLVGVLGSWLLSLPQGGVLGPLDYLGQTLGLLVPVMIAIAAVAAWLGSR